MGRFGRRHLAGQHRDPVVADGGGEHLQQRGARLLQDAAQRSRRLGQRELHVLRLRRSDDVHGERLRRHELRGADVGRLPRAREPAGGFEQRHDRLHRSARSTRPANSTLFHDITSGTSGSYKAGTGYDLVTGWGSPNGSGLINLLAGSQTTQPSFSLSSSPSSVSITQGGAAGTSTIQRDRRRRVLGRRDARRVWVAQWRDRIVRNQSDHRIERAQPDRELDRDDR